MGYKIPRLTCIHIELSAFCILVGKILQVFPTFHILKLKKQNGDKKPPTTKIANSLSCLKGNRWVGESVNNTQCTKGLGILERQHELLLYDKKGLCGSNYEMCYWSLKPKVLPNLDLDSVVNGYIHDAYFEKKNPEKRTTRVIVPS